MRSGAWQVHPKLSNTGRNVSKHQAPSLAPCSMTMSLVMAFAPSAAPPAAIRGAGHRQRLEAEGSFQDLPAQDWRQVAFTPVEAVVTRPQNPSQPPRLIAFLP